MRKYLWIMACVLFFLFSFQFQPPASAAPVEPATLSAQDIICVRLPGTIMSETESCIEVMEMIVCGCTWSWGVPINCQEVHFCTYRSCQFDGGFSFQVFCI
jgi:hypothetical protein